MFHSKSFQTGQFDWSDDLQGVILGSFSYGYIASQILGGYLAGRFGPKKTVFWGVALSTVCTLLGPLASIGSPYLLIITQVAEWHRSGEQIPCTCQNYKNGNETRNVFLKSIISDQKFKLTHYRITTSFLLVTSLN